jgi:hypothetical protein
MEMRFGSTDQFVAWMGFASCHSRCTGCRRRTQVPERLVTGLLPLPLDPGIGFLQRLRGGKKVFLVEIARSLPGVILVLVAPAEAVPAPVLGLRLPLPDGDVNPPEVDLVPGFGSLGTVDRVD